MNGQNYKSEIYYPIKYTYFKLGRTPCMLYEPADAFDRNRIAVISMHSDQDYLSFNAGPELAKRGFTSICANVSSSDLPLEKKLLEVKAVCESARQNSGARAVVLLGHSGGATLMSAYQDAAENGVGIFQGDEKIIRCADIGPLSPADGVMFLDSNYGNGAMELLSLDPAVKNEGGGMELDPELDAFNPANGFDPCGSKYSETFVRKFQKAQGERNNRLIDAAIERLRLIENCKGNYIDDEPFVVPSGVHIRFNNKLFPQDIRLLSHTKKAWPLLHADGSATTEIIRSVRRPEGGKSLTNELWGGALRTTVRTFLDSHTVRTTADFGYGEDYIQGVVWESSFCCPPGNVMGIASPMLVMGMTGGYEYIAAETIYDNALRSKDKTIAFVEGADHEFSTAKECEAYPGQFGDTLKIVFDFVDQWLRGRFSG